MKTQAGFFDEEERLEALSRLGDPLARVAAVVDFEQFRPELDRLLAHHVKGPGGRPAWDRVLMLKVLLLQRWYGLSDRQVEYQVEDRLSFRRFLHLKLGDKAPDARTVRAFRTRLGPSGVEALLDAATAEVHRQGLVARPGTFAGPTFATIRRRPSPDGGSAGGEGDGEPVPPGT